jgi:hypothetical protein
VSENGVIKTVLCLNAGELVAQIAAKLNLNLAENITALTTVVKNCNTGAWLLDDAVANKAKALSQARLKSFLEDLATYKGWGLDLKSQSPKLVDVWAKATTEVRQNVKFGEFFTDLMAENGAIGDYYLAKTSTAEIGRIEKAWKGLYSQPNLRNNLAGIKNVESWLLKPNIFVEDVGGTCKIRYKLEDIGVIKDGELLTTKRVPNFYDNPTSWTPVGEPMNAVQLFQKGSDFVFGRKVDISFLSPAQQAYFTGLPNAHGIPRHFKISEIAAKYRLLTDFAADGAKESVMISSCLDSEAKLIAAIEATKPGTPAFASGVISGVDKIVTYTLPSVAPVVPDFGFYIEKANPNLIIRGKTFTCRWTMTSSGEWKINTFYCGQ